MHFAEVKFTLSAEDAAVFGTAVMGIRNFRWFDRKQNPMTTSIARAEVSIFISLYAPEKIDL